MENGNLWWVLGLVGFMGFMDFGVLWVLWEGGSESCRDASHLRADQPDARVLPGGLVDQRPAAAEPAFVHVVQPLLTSWKRTEITSDHQ